MADMRAAPAPMADMPTGAPGDVAAPKMKNRQRLLRGIQRMSSSPSLTHIGRPRASSAPYENRGSFSCVSLAPSASPLSPYASTSPSIVASSAASTMSPPSGPGTPMSEISSCDGLDSPFVGVRRVDSLRSKASPLSSTSVLPTDLKSTRNERNATRLRSGSQPMKRKNFNFWSDMPYELRIQIFSYLEPKELVRVSRVSKSFYNASFDGQLWTEVDASEVYRKIPAESLGKIISATAPFIKDLNLRGCIQVEHQRRAEVLVNSCKNLVNVNLEGCRNIQRSTLHGLLNGNERLECLNLTGLTAVTNATCDIIAESCKNLEVLQVSWCKQMDAEGIRAIVNACPRLKDVRAGELKGFDNVEVAAAFFARNTLERLVLSGCSDLTDMALQTIVHGVNPEIDILTDLPLVPTRALRHLDLSRCSQLTDRGISALGHFVPNLEGLQISGCSGLTDLALQPIFDTASRLSLIEMDDLPEVTNTLLSEHLAKSACVSRLEHLSVGYCSNLGDAGILPLVRNCSNLKMADFNNTRISDLVLAEAAAMVNARSRRTVDPREAPKTTLNMVVYDCENVTWTGIREVLFRNSQVQFNGGESEPTFPTEIIGLKCFYGYQMTVDEHSKRVLRCDLPAAGRLERKWADYMQASEEAGVGGAGTRRRRRRARETRLIHADEEEGGYGHAGRRRARTAPSCAVM
ncbi:hypothetical protein jhhlp_006883 [Lomentospora prolificans]|uniref:F-box domain-containing protein n=1 Tax=Lomentospora prolificans TaxID=41688 RepID=A0A2N3N309_9PEZI|nr:hypothetical protein jhhlp_006883 [Lomentospora prolificans]